MRKGRNYISSDHLGTAICSSVTPSGEIRFLESGDKWYSQQTTQKITKIAVVSGNICSLSLMSRKTGEMASLSYGENMLHLCSWERCSRTLQMKPFYHSPLLKGPQGRPPPPLHVHPQASISGLQHTELTQQPHFQFVLSPRN